MANQETIGDGQAESLWVATTERTSYQPLNADQSIYDLAIVGGGITGIMAAYYASRRGLRTVLVERARLAEWTTGGTTAKLSAQHYLIYDYLIKRHGQEAAQAFANANQNGISQVENISQALGIDSEFSRRDAYVYTHQDEKLDEMHAEVAAAQSLGLPASFETEIDLPLPVTGAVRFTQQAQFHPRKFLLPLAADFVRHGGVIYEQTEATSIVPGEPSTIVTKHGEIRANHVFQASGEPFWGGEIFDGFMWLKMSYALAVKLRNGHPYPASLYITTDQPMRTMRSATYQDEPVLIFGGESHQYDQATYNEDLRYQALVEDVHAKFPVEEVLFHWLAGDFMPYDRMPYIGALPQYPNIYVSTGYRAWGLAWAVSAADLVISDILGEPLDWAHHFSLARLATPLRDEDKTLGL